MTMSGSFIKMGSKMATTYEPSAKGLFSLIDDFYAQQSAIAKSAGAVGYGMGSPNGEGYFNAIMGKEITAGIFSSDNVFTALGARAYDHEGVRIQYEQAAYGMASEMTHGGENMLGWKPVDEEGNPVPDYFAGIGAGTNQDGLVPDSVYLPVDDFREPYKEVTFAYDYGLGLQALENKDDTIAYKTYVDRMSTNYSDLIDKTILRPLESPLPVAANNTYPHQYGLYGETGLQGISRCIASGNEIDKKYNGVDITAGMVSPYGGLGGDFAAYRNATNRDGSHKENNIDGNFIDAGGAVLDISMMRKAYRTASVNWDDSANPNGKMWAMSNVAQDKLGALMQANNILLNTVYAKRDFNGVSTTPGRDAGILLNSFNNIPIIQDGNLNFDYTKRKVSAVKMGDIYLLDLKHIWMSMLTPVEMFSNNNPAVNRTLMERNVMNARMEVRIDKFIGHCKIVGLADDN